MQETASLSRIRPGKNPREFFDEAEMNELAESIRSYGVLQPILVRPADEVGAYVIIAGERRYRAAKAVFGDDYEIPIVVRDFNDGDAEAAAIIENVHRAQMSIAEESKAKVPMWGFSGSPLVAQGRVCVITGGPNQKAVAAYDALTGNPAWTTGVGWSFASLQMATLDGLEQILFVSQHGIGGLNPTDGHTLWQHEFELTDNANRCIQPTILGANDLLLGAAFGMGTQRVNIKQEGGVWKEQGLWTTRKFNPYYNDMVYQNGYCYGFDNSALACLDIATGDVKWRAKSYGNGQVLLLADQGLVLVLGETGVAALVEAKPDARHEIGRFQALEGKTWNHPVIAHGKLFVRNGEQAACYEVSGK